MADLRENAIEFYSDEKIATVTFNQGRYVSKIERLAKQYPGEVEIMARNKDGSIVAHIPVEYIKINRTKRDLTDEERIELSERARRNFHSDKDVDE